ncbi:DgyrCDS8351 [Dimorphilus gyrociliatus]|uniref:DgyrCDS8351 n=1 Tax=Dimorphilus gyrociliatus TaxID=2664684 RepID=A0A7I8VTW4_9ANNE|nr:DgyrCDS8351 [Dimorphilus gyrociliatus]
MASTDADDCKHYIGSVQDVRQRCRTTAEVGGRKVTVFALKTSFYALDDKCYHAGGPLELGDIEEINNDLCIVCPWHKYIIKLSSGEGVYQGIDPATKKTEWKTKGVKQRVHEVVVENGHVYVRLNLAGKLDCDRYYTEEYRKLMNEDVVDLKFDFSDPNTKIE